MGSRPEYVTLATKVLSIVWLDLLVPAEVALAMPKTPPIREDPHIPGSLDSL